MKILVVLASPEYLRFYDTTIAELARREHDVVIAVNTIPGRKPVRVEEIEQLHSRIVFGGVVPPRADRWEALARAVRGTMDFVRYLHPVLASAPALRARMKRQALPRVLQWLDHIRALPAPVVDRMMRGLVALEHAVPSARRLLDYLDRYAPDLVLVTPLVEAASDQVDLVRAAQARGIRVGTLVASWDNLTNKGDLRVPGALVVVWNQAQKQEALQLHRVPPEHVAVTGSQVFDRWFDRKPSRDRETFCRMVGLPPDKPFVLYTGSSIFISRANVEVPFVQRWIAALRASGDSLREIAVLVRPHPYNGSAWPQVDFGTDVAVWPRGGYNPIDEANRDAFFDSLYYSEAVVGINTSAMIEAAIVGRPVLSILLPEFQASQERTLHFHYLLSDNGGFVRTASSLEEHTRQLAAVLRDPSAVRAEIDRFVSWFVRPHGAEKPSLPILVDAIERYGNTPAPAVQRSSPRLLALRALLFPLTFTGGWLRPAASRKRSRVTRARRRRRSVGAPMTEVTSGPADGVRNLIAVSVAAPVLIGTLLTSVFVLGEVAGRAPLVGDSPGNIAEAAGLGSGAEVLRMLRRGDDPMRPLPVGPEIISREITRVTALEAAVWSRRIRLVQLLDREGAIRGDEARRHVTCVAVAVGVDEVVEYLSPQRTPACDPEQVIHAIRRRSE